MSESTDPVLAAVEVRLAEVEDALAAYESLREERSRLLKAKAALLGQAHAVGQTRLRQEDVVAYLREQPDSTPSDIASGLDVTEGTIRAHLHRGGGEDGVFVQHGREWRLAEREE